MRSPIYFMLVRLDDGDLASLTTIREPTELFAQLRSYGFTEHSGASSPALADMSTGAFPDTLGTLGTLDRLWAIAFLAQTGGHVVGLVGILVMTGMHMYLTWHACITGFGQIWSLPDRVLVWTGQPGAGGEASLTSGAFGNMLARAGRGNPRVAGLSAA